MTYESERRQFDKGVYDNFAAINSGENIPSNIRASFAAEAFSQDIPKTAQDLTKKLELVYSAAEGKSQKGFVDRKDLQVVADQATNPGIKAAATIAVEHYDSIATVQPSIYKSLGGLRECNYVNRAGGITGCPRGVEINIGIGRKQISDMSLYADETASKQYVADHALPYGLGWLEPGRGEAMTKQMTDQRNMLQRWVSDYQKSHAQ